MRQWFTFVVAEKNRRGPDENRSSGMDVCSSISHDLGQNSWSSFVLWLLHFCNQASALHTTPAII